jgi:acid phosphatase type 7
VLYLNIFYQTLFIVNVLNFIYKLKNNLISILNIGYHCGSQKYGWSPFFYFKTMKKGTDWSPTFAIYGDLGNENSQSLPFLQEEVVFGHLDAILHIGDFAYDMYKVI